MRFPKIQISGTGLALVTGIAPALGINLPTWFRWGIFAVGVVMCIAPPLLSGVQHAKRIGRMIPFLGLIFFGCGFIGCVVWYAWPNRPSLHIDEPPPFRSDKNKEVVSAQEQFRRNILLTDIIEKYKNENPNLSPDILTGLQYPPDSFVNSNLERLGEQWKFSSELIPTTEPGILVECFHTRFPLKFSDDGRLWAMNVWPVPIDARGGGLGQYSGLGEFNSVHGV